MLPCPRRAESARSYGKPEDDKFDSSCCSYCGSMDPALFLQRLEEGTLLLGSTDKNYKVYVRNRGGENLSTIKFYFQHLSPEQQDKFIALWNADLKLPPDDKKFVFEGGYSFYNWPFFMRPKNDS